MKYLWKRFLALTLGLGLVSMVAAGPPGTGLPTARWANPVQQQPTQPAPVIRGVSYEQPAGPRPLVPFEQPRQPGVTVTLQRPVPLPDSGPVPEPLPNPIVDSQVQPIGFNGQLTDPVTGRPVALRPEAGQIAPGMFTWNKLPAGDDKKGIETGPVPKPEPLLNPPMQVPGTNPAPLHSYQPAPVIGTGPILTGPITSGPVIGAPIVSTPTPAYQVTPQPPIVGAPTNACPSPGCFGMPAGYAPCPEMVDGGGCYSPWQCFYFSAEYLMWFTSAGNPPPLVTTGPITSPLPGALGQQGTVILSDQDILDDLRSGARFSAGVWFDDAKCIGMDGSFFFLGKEHQRETFASTGAFELARPLIFTGNGQEFVQVTASSLPPQRSSGAILIDHDSELFGWDANFRTNVLCWQNCYVDLLLGYRGLALNENTTIVELVNSQEPTEPGSFLLTDQFSTRNRFHGGQIGFAAEKRFLERFTLGLKAKVALGTTRQEANISGSTIITGSNGNDGTYPVGILAQGNYLGSHARNVFSVVPEVQVDLGFQLSPHIRASVGYNFLYWSNVARSSEQINRAVNPALFAPPVPGASNPTQFAFKNAGYWAQGINFGLEFRW